MKFKIKVVPPAEVLRRKMFRRVRYREDVLYSYYKFDFLTSKYSEAIIEALPLLLTKVRVDFITFKCHSITIFSDKFNETIFFSKSLVIAL